ncbi:ABC transporter permease subunit [Salinarimonas ramus]|uniref:ABC transporter permease n=1 Tax=Salinarimonas ramus TaxID=690164 RepID=A0A917QF30_9HYPH|nr:ABC transporter permease subunit [Salinarimonas ramus]GGK47638.1 ABC transporter permease [Salinarimonas ramus]
MRRTDDIASGAGASRAVSSPARPARRRRAPTALLLAPMGLWLAIGFAAPMLTVTLLSLQAETGVFAPVSLVPSPAQFAAVLGDVYYLGILFQTLWTGLATAFLSAVLGLPLALWLASLPARWQPLGVALVLIPLLTNVVVRSIGFILFMASNGPLASLTGIDILFTRAAVIVALTQVFMPFLVMALFDALSTRDARIDEAASSLGATPTDRFWHVTLPIALPALRAGVTIVFLLSATAYVSATLIGGGKVWVIGRLVYEEALLIQNYPLASALALVLLAACLAVTWLLNVVFARMTPWLQPQERRASTAGPGVTLPPRLRRALRAVAPTVRFALLAMALFLLVGPLVFVAVNSVNDVPQATAAAWRGFTLRWYVQIFSEGSNYIDAAILSAQLAGISATCAVLVALPASFALVRRRSRAVTVAGGLYLLPLALPGIALALGVLRLLQWFYAIPPFLGLVVVHVVLVAPFTLVMLRAAVDSLDIRLEEAAASLGARPMRSFVLVVVPALAPALFASGVIAFLVSFGEVTVTAFLTTARMLTLPVRIYADVQFDVEPTVNVISVLTIVMTVLALAAVNRIVGLDRVWRR